MGYFQESLSPYQENLQSQVNQIGYRLEYYPEVPSTMDIIEEHLRNGRLSAILALTDHQTKGAGREGRVWHDIAGSSIMFSTNKRAREREQGGILADLAALLACKATQDKTGIEDLKLKYPNDFVIDGAKTGGVLVRGVYDGQRYLGFNIGMGVNVHYKEEDLVGYSSESNYPATALDLHTPDFNNRQDVLVAILSAIRYIDSTAQIFSTNRQVQQDLNNLWRDYSLVLNRRVRVLTPDRVIVNGRVVSTEIGQGILVEIGGGVSRKRFNQFETNMSLRILE